MFKLKKLLVAGLFVTGAVVLAGCGAKSANNAELVSFAQCVTDAGAVFYGTEWCPHCKNQKALFGVAAMEKIKFIDCDQQKALCDSANVTGYPTWVYRDGSSVAGTQELAAIAAKTNCALPTVGSGS